MREIKPALPSGGKGQLVVTGPGVCNGYVNRPDLTAGKFVVKTPSLADLPGDIMYPSREMQPSLHLMADVDLQGRIR
jgi:non-ribosomal peptide synthetase component F